MFKNPMIFHLFYIIAVSSIALFSSGLYEAPPSLSGPMWSFNRFDWSTCFRNVTPLPKFFKHTTNGTQPGVKFFLWWKAALHTKEHL